VYFHFYLVYNDLYRFTAAASGSAIWMLDKDNQMRFAFVAGVRES